jgi:hypothetical protein
VQSLLPAVTDFPLVARAGRPLHIRARVQNLSGRAFPADATYSRRFVRLGTQLLDAGGELINRDFARTGLPSALGPGESVELTVAIPPLARSGRYGLKFDLVNEGIDWFERCGSTTTTRPLVVG